MFRIYTDGSCSGNPGPGGWALVYNTEDGCVTRSGGEASTTNNRMELTAVLKTLSIISKIGSKSDKFEIYSDSAYVVNSINNGWLFRWRLCKWKTKQGDDIKNRDLWEKLYKILVKLQNEGWEIKLHKVKGHAGDTFNEMVDKLARKESMMAKLNT